MPLKRKRLCANLESGGEGSIGNARTECAGQSVFFRRCFNIRLLGRKSGISSKQQSVDMLVFFMFLFIERKGVVLLAGGKLLRFKCLKQQQQQKLVALENKRVGLCHKTEGRSLVPSFLKR